MPTRDAMETIIERIKESPKFKRARLARAVELCNSGEVDVAKITLRNYIAGTIGYEELAKKLGTSPKSIKAMLNVGSNPRANDLFALINELQESTGVHLNVNGVKRCHHHQREDYEPAKNRRAKTAKPKPKLKNTTIAGPVGMSQ